MAPPNQLGKRVKLTQVRRPFIVGSTAVPFSEANPKPVGVPEGHTHSWTVFVKGLEDTDITYWLRRVQFKLHDSIPNHVRMIEAEQGRPFAVSDTGWGEFDVAIKLYYVNESGEKPQTLYHYLRLHPFGRTEEEKASMVMENGEVRSWSYEEQLFNEPYTAFYRVLTSGAVPRGSLPTSSSSTSTPIGGKGKSTAAATAATTKGAGPRVPPLPSPDSGDVWERTAMIPNTNRPGQPFSRETEAAEVRKLKDATVATEEWTRKVLEELKRKEELLAKLKAENAAAASAAAAASQS
ncbi:YEATS domain-containing protein 4 [Geosmithia morbida]|uniref:Protein AF-9 homolog n=1 Tax=Geosmithia morbida TaxID=1094350 RepID=A0A9P4YRQ7_9HYPO|nr:YEATS domain-containing protein 4 [Geosmithia morbida]KAF4121332.1 YEATS domain-containing protein 4 [Geosmithia morbida]